MEQYGILMGRELFPGSGIVRSFGYKAAASGDYYAFIGETDCLYAARRGPG